MFEEQTYDQEFKLGSAPMLDLLTVPRHNLTEVLPAPLTLTPTLLNIAMATRRS